jgi:predicted DCC family thiol-disulfide oxidoreductase YuxK
MNRLHFLVSCLWYLAVSDAFSSSSVKCIRSSAFDSHNFLKATGKEGVEWDWEKTANDVFKDDQRPIVLFDGVCNLCNGGVNFAIDRDEDAKLRFASLQSKVAQSLLLRAGRSPEESNIVMVTKDDAFFSSDAVSKICLELDTKPLQFLGQLGQLSPDWVRESVYKYVSSNRYYFGENDQCRLDFDGTYTSRFVSDPLED